MGVDSQLPTCESLNDGQIIDISVCTVHVKKHFFLKPLGGKTPLVPLCARPCGQPGRGPSITVQKYAISYGEFINGIRFAQHDHAHN